MHDTPPELTDLHRYLERLVRPWVVDALAHGVARVDIKADAVLQRLQLVVDQAFGEGVRAALARGRVRFWAPVETPLEPRTLTFERDGEKYSYLTNQLPLNTKRLVFVDGAADLGGLNPAEHPDTVWWCTAPGSKPPIRIYDVEPADPRR